jgi:glucans biosynthesis protein
MNRRACLALATSALATSLLPQARAQTTPPATQPFSEDGLDKVVRELAAKPYAAPQPKLDDGLDTVTYDQYRDNIVFKPENAIWREESLDFRLDLFQAAGSFYAFPVEIAIVDNGVATPVRYAPSLFSFTAPVRTPGPQSQAGFAGFRIRSPINGDVTVYDDVATFLGASYFRAVGAGQVGGLSSSRGLAINTGQSGGEEFPLFRSYFIEKPKPGQRQLVIHAVLDSASAAGRYKFTVRPGPQTVIEVEAFVYPRKRLPYVGVAPLTGMFFFAPHAPARRRDIRPRAHDVEALSMRTGMDEWIVRPLINPERLQFSVFTDRNPKGFGLVQRARSLTDYQDLSAAYEKRPSLWVEPRGEWGDGFVDLIELPAADDVHDNVIAFWRPKDGLTPSPNGSQFNYAITFGLTPPQPTSRAPVIQTRVGDGRGNDVAFVVDFAVPPGMELLNPLPQAHVSSSSGEIRLVTLTPIPNVRSVRLSFQFVPSGNQTSDLRAVLQQGANPVSETWLFRWAR